MLINYYEELSFSYYASGWWYALVNDNEQNYENMNTEYGHVLLHSKELYFRYITQRHSDT